MVTELAACMGYKDGRCRSIETSCNNLKAKKKGWSITVAQAERKTHGSANSQWNGTVWTMGLKKKVMRSDLPEFWTVMARIYNVTKKVHLAVPKFARKMDANPFTTSYIKLLPSKIFQMVWNGWWMACAVYNEIKRSLTVWRQSNEEPLAGL